MTLELKYDVLILEEGSGGDYTIYTNVPESVLKPYIEYLDGSYASKLEKKRKEFIKQNPSLENNVKELIPFDDFDTYKNKFKKYKTKSYTGFQNFKNKVFIGIDFW